MYEFPRTRKSTMLAPVFLPRELGRSVLSVWSILCMDIEQKEVSKGILVFSKLLWKEALRGFFCANDACYAWS